MASIALCFLFLLGTVAATDDTTLTSLSTSSTPTVTDRRHQLRYGNCGDGHCDCWDGRAECDGNFYEVKRIPPLPSDIGKVTITFFDLIHFSAETAGELMSLQLLELRLEFCNIESIDPGMLTSLGNLSVLSFSESPVPETALHRGLEGLSRGNLEDLELTHMNLKSLLPLTSMQSATVQALDLGFNPFSTLNFSALQALKGLSTLKIQSAYVRDVYLTYLPDLKELDLEENEIDEFFDFCQNGNAVFPKLDYLSLRNNEIQSIPPSNVKCLTSLRVLDISSNKLYYFMPNTFSPLKSLETISMQDMKGDFFSMAAFSFNNSNLFYLDISNIHLSTNFKFNTAFLAGCSNLTFLDISDNDLSPLSDQMLSSLFSDMPLLEEFLAGGCNLKQIPDFLVSFHKLTYLDLSGNTFTTLAHPPAMEMQDRLKFVNLGDNPFQCSCSWLWLKEWIARNTTEFVRYPDSYVCSNPPYAGVLLKDFPLSEEACLLGPTTAYLVVALSSVLMFLVSILPVIYRYRWHIQYLAFMFRYDRHRQHRNAEEEARNFRFDAFVIYDSRDHAWVVRQLMPALEDTRGLKLCLHERDFLAGNLIVDNIVDSISASRKVIAVMSEGTATSEWCQFELSLTHRLTLERGHDLMVVVMLQEVARALVTKTMYAVLKMTTYIAWPDEERAREAFWNRLGEAVRD